MRISVIIAEMEDLNVNAGMIHKGDEMPRYKGEVSIDLIKSPLLVVEVDVDEKELSKLPEDRHEAYIDLCIVHALRDRFEIKHRRIA